MLSYEYYYDLIYINFNGKVIMETEKYRSNTISGGIQSTALSPEVSKVLRSTYMPLARLWQAYPWLLMRPILD
jgi:hypothetical protein